MMTTHAAQALDDVELVEEKSVGTPAAARSRSTCHDASTATGSRPRRLIEDERSGRSRVRRPLDALVAQRQALHLVAASFLQAQALGPGSRRRLGEEADSP